MVLGERELAPSRLLAGVGATLHFSFNLFFVLMSRKEGCATSKLWKFARVTMLGFLAHANMLVSGAGTRAEPPTGCGSLQW